MILDFLNSLVFVVFKTIINFISKFFLEPILKFLIEFIMAMTSYYFYQISVLLLSVVDMLSDFFYMLAGIKLYSAPGQAANESGLYFENLKNFFTNKNITKNDGELLFQLIVSEPVMQTFISVMTVGLFLVIMTSLIMIIKQEFDPDKPNNKMAIVASALKSFLYMIFVPVICIFGIFISNRLLQLVHTATSNGGGATISGAIFVSACQDAWYDDPTDYVSLSDPYTAAITVGMNAMIDVFTGANNPIKTKVDDLITDKLERSLGTASTRKSITDAYIYIDKHDDSIAVAGFSCVVVYIGGSDRMVFTAKGLFDVIKPYIKDVNLSDYDKDDLKKPEKIIKWLKYSGLRPEDPLKFGDDEVELTNIKFFDDKNDAKSYSKSGAVGGKEPVGVYFNDFAYRAYFNSLQVSKDFNASKINYFVLIISTIIIIKALASSSVGLIMRLYKAVGFFLILPGVIGLSPLDGGSSFSSWKKTFISEVIAAYGFVIAVNMYMFLVPIVSNMDIKYEATNYHPLVSGGAAIAMNLIASPDVAAAIIKIIFIITGALMIEKLASTISGFIGGVDLASVGKSMMSSIGKTASTGVSVGGKMAIGTAALGAKLGSKAYGGIANKVKSVGRGIKTWRDKDKGFKETGLGKAWNNFMGGETKDQRKATKASEGGILKRSAKATGRKISSGFGNLKTGFGNLASRGFLSKHSKSGKAMYYARANFIDAQNSFNKANSAYNQAVEEKDALEAKFAGRELNDEERAQLEAATTKMNEAYELREAALNKYTEETNKYEGTASAISQGSFKKAQATALTGLTTVLDSIPGADIAKGIWGKRKEAADETDNASDRNRGRSERINQMAKDFRDKISMLDPLNRAHAKMAPLTHLNNIMSMTEEKLANSLKEKQKALEYYIQAVQECNDKKDYDGVQRLKDAAKSEYLSITGNAEADRAQFKTDYQAYTTIPIKLAEIRSSNASAKTKLQQAQKLLQENAITANQPEFKDMLEAIQALRDSMG